MIPTKDPFIPIAIAFGAAALQPTVRFIDQELRSTTDVLKAIESTAAMDRLAAKLEELIQRPCETATELEGVKTVWNKTKKQISEYVSKHASANYPASLFITLELIHLLEVRLNRKELKAKIEVIPEKAIGISSEILGKLAHARNVLFITRAALREKCRQLFAADVKEKQILWLRTKGADISPIALDKTASLKTFQEPLPEDPQVDESMSLESVMLTILAYKIRDNIQKSGVGKVGALEGFLHTLAISQETESRKSYLLKWLELAETDFDERDGLHRWNSLSKDYLQKYLDRPTGFAEVDRVVRAAKELFDHDTQPISDSLGVDLTSFRKSVTDNEYSKIITLVGQKSNAFFSRYAAELVKKSEDNSESELEFYRSISSKITEAINNSGKGKKGLLEKFGGLGRPKVELPLELQDISFATFSKNLDHIIKMSAKVSSSRISTLYEAAVANQKLAELSLNPKRISPKAKKTSKANRGKKQDFAVSKIASVDSSSAPVDKIVVNREPSSVEKTSIVKSPIRELLSPLHLHDRVRRWFNPIEGADPFKVDPLYMSNSYSDIAKRKIRLEHNFGLAVDSLVAGFGQQDGNRNKFLIAEIETGEERWMCILLYCFTKDGVCFHRYAHRKSAKEVLDKQVKFAEKGIMELEYPKIGDLRATKEYTKEFLSDGSYIKSKSENITTVIDPKNDATIRVWTQKVES